MGFTYDLRAATQMDKSFKIFRMNRLGIPQDRIAKRLGMDQKTIHYHLGKMPVLAFSLNADLSQGFTVSQVAQKHGWTEPMVWSLTPWLPSVSPQWSLQQCIKNEYWALQAGM